MKRKPVAAFIFFFLLSAITTLKSHSQTVSQTKVAYADIEYIFNKMPEAKVIQAELKSVETLLTKEIDLKTAELKQKYAEYLKGDLLEPVRNNLEREMEMQQKNLEQLKQDAQTNYQTKQAQLLEPVYKKMSKAIEEVAKENGYTVVLNPKVGTQNLLLYADEKMNISDLILKKLGVKLPEPAK